MIGCGQGSGSPIPSMLHTLTRALAEAKPVLGVLGREQRATPDQLGGLRSAVSSLQYMGQGTEPRSKRILLRFHLRRTRLVLSICLILKMLLSLTATIQHHGEYSTVCQFDFVNKSSAVAEMGDRGHNRHGPKRGGCCAPFAERWEPV